MVKFIETESGTVATRGRGCGEQGESYLVGMEFHLMMIKKVPELNSGGGCTTNEKYLSHRLYTSTANFMLCIFYDE